MLAPHRLDRHAARDRQPFGVIGHSDAVPAACHRGLGHLGDRLDAIAPRRMHLAVAAIILEADEIGDVEAEEPDAPRPG